MSSISPVRCRLDFALAANKGLDGPHRSITSGGWTSASGYALRGQRPHHCSKKTLTLNVANDRLEPILTDAAAYLKDRKGTRFPVSR